MPVKRLSEIALAASPPAATDTVVGVRGGNTDQQFTPAQVVTGSTPGAIDGQVLCFNGPDNKWEADQRIIGPSGTTGSGVTITSGSGSTGNAGPINITGGNSSSGFGGHVAIRAGMSATNHYGTNVGLYAGVGGVGRAGGQVKMSGGYILGAPGIGISQMTMQGCYNGVGGHYGGSILGGGGYYHAEGGTFIVAGGSRTGATNGGDVDFYGGNGSSTGYGGNIRMYGGYGGSGNGNGGNVILKGGAGGGAGSRGNIIMKSLPTSAAGLPSGAVWNSSGTLHIA